MTWLRQQSVPSAEYRLSDWNDSLPCQVACLFDLTRKKSHQSRGVRTPSVRVNFRSTRVPFLIMDAARSPKWTSFKLSNGERRLVPVHWLLKCGFIIDHLQQHVTATLVCWCGLHRTVQWTWNPHGCFWNKKDITRARDQGTQRKRTVSFRPTRTTWVEFKMALRRSWVGQIRQSVMRYLTKPPNQLRSVNVRLRLQSNIRPLRSEAQSDHLLVPWHNGRLIATITRAGKSETLSSTLFTG